MATTIRIPTPLRSYTNGLDEIPVQGKTDAAIAELTIQAVEHFVGKTGLPRRLSEINIPKESFPALAKMAVNDPGMKSNMRRVTDPQEIIPVLEAAW